jgi:glyoxylase-like metal-dependent hydrolase (beta-lactamase superfamily II)
VIGRRNAVVIDPGPDVDSHVRALASRLVDAERVTILLTHGHHDHAGAAEALARTVDAPVWGPRGLESHGVGPVHRTIAEGDEIDTDEGVLRVVHTPGHTREHLCFHWTSRKALFAGDLLLGEGDTTWVAEYPGCVADYLDSLTRVRALEVSVIYPAHGPALRDADAALDRFERHRRRRIEQVAEVLRAYPGAGLEELLDRVYGTGLPSGVRGAAIRSLGALVDFVRGVPGVRAEAGDV